MEQSIKTLQEFNEQTKAIRAQLISNIERAIVHQSKWNNEDYPPLMQQLGELWALLKCGARFRIVTEQTATLEERTSGNISDKNSIYVSVTFLSPEGAKLPVEDPRRQDLQVTSMYVMPSEAVLTTHPIYK